MNQFAHCRQAKLRNDPAALGENGQLQASGRHFSDEQRRWLEMIRDYIASNLQIGSEDFEYAPFAQEGGIGKV